MNYQDRVLQLDSAFPEDKEMGPRVAFVVGHREGIESAADIAAEADKHIAEMAVENAELRESLRSLIDHYDSVTCYHDHTHRGGVIWTICDDCGMKWSDDRNPFTPYVEPEWVTRARDLLPGKLAHKADTTEELREQLAAKDVELERVRLDRARIVSAAAMVVSNWDIFEIQDTTARAVFGHSIGWLRDALASPAGEAVQKSAQQLAEDERYRRMGLAAICCESIRISHGGNMYDAAGGVIDSFEPEAVVTSLTGQVYRADDLKTALLEMYESEFVEGDANVR